MITATGRSAVEEEIELMRFTSLERRQPILGLDYADDPAYEPEKHTDSTPSLFSRWMERLFAWLEA